MKLNRMAMSIAAMALTFAMAPAVAFASSPREAASRYTVKVYSGSGSLSFAGSGVLFSHAGQAYALTSEHVLLHGNRGYQHRVFHPARGELEATLVAADWGVGLALLKVHGLRARLPGLDLFAPGAARQGQPVVVAGFPYASRSAIAEAGGAVLLPESDRGEVPLLPSLVELWKAHGEYGMSGGPVFDQDSKVLGLLSHQYLQIRQGKATLLQEWKGEFPPSSAQALVDNHLLVIPGAMIRAWLTACLDPSGNFAPSFVRDPERQIKNEESLLSEGLRFEWKEISSADGHGHGIGGGDGHGIGGGDGHGIGGGDGHGIGGGDGHGIGGASGGTETVLEVSLDPEFRRREFQARWQQSAHKAWFARLRAWIEARGAIRIRGWATQAQGDATLLQLQPVASLGGFFRQLAFAPSAPTAVLDFPADSVQPGAPIQGSQAAAVKLLEVADQILPSLAHRDARVLARSIAIVARLASAPGDSVLEPRMIQDQLAHPGWERIFAEQWDLGVSLYHRLEMLQAALKAEALTAGP